LLVPRRSVPLLMMMMMMTMTLKAPAKRRAEIDEAQPCIP
jgi:hypothetical protein